MVVVESLESPFDKSSQINNNGHGEINSTDFLTTSNGKPKGLKNAIKRRILYFSPIWFTANMATGQISILLHNLPYSFKGLPTISVIVFILNILLFIIFLAATITRYILYPSLWNLSFLHPTQSSYWSTFSMGLSTIVTAGIYIATPQFGASFTIFLWSIWIIVVLLAIASNIWIPYIQFTRHSNVEFSIVFLNPVVAPVIASACGSVVASALPAREALITVVICYVLLGLSVPVAFWIYALFYQRLMVHKIPLSSLVISMVLPVGPCGQTAFALIKLSDVLRKLYTQGYLDSELYSSQELLIGITAIHFISLLMGIFLIALGIWWILLATTAIIEMSIKKGVPFNLGFFGLIFPIGTVATSSLLVYEDLNFFPFKVISMLLSVSVISIWVAVFSRTAYETYTGTIFVDPCVPENGELPPS